MSNVNVGKSFREVSALLSAYRGIVILLIVRVKASLGGFTVGGVTEQNCDLPKQKTAK